MSPRRHALVVQHAPTGPPALLGAWLEERGIPWELCDTSTGAPLPGLEGVRFVASLGAAASAADTHLPAVAAETALVEHAVADDVPVLGLCFGGQLLARVLGGTVEPMDAPEVGWVSIETDDPALVPAGPWLAWHYDRYTVPPAATEIARTEHSSHAFVRGSHLGVQFHPESTQEHVRVWAAKDAERLASFGITDGLQRLEAPSTTEQAARAAAFALFDAFLSRIPDPVPTS
ncbi:MAG: type 1 glutamine amidotransferase [Solirubrobacterales bacterium]|nr:type 1 glutamine amidotransferase [Solirubrobacterales bacterium]